MKQLFKVLFFVSLFYSEAAFAQLNIGPKIGTNSSFVSVMDKTISNSEGNPVYGFHGGVFGRAQISFLFIQPEILFMSGTGEIEIIDDKSNVQTVDYDFNRLDFPVQVGFRLGKVLRIGGGPVFSVLLEDSVHGSTNNSLSFKDSSVGYQVGLGFDIWKLVFDLKYEGSLSKVQDSFLKIPTDQRISQIVFGLGLKMF
jgi:hypothetical protein